MSGICDTCKRNNDCRKPIGGMDSCRLYVSGKESNYTRLFGTPERAARTAYRLVMCGITTVCDECPIREGCEVSTDADCDNGEGALLEWLRGDA